MNQDQIDRYVSGRMSESDAQAFEEYCLANPDFARHVEFEQRLKGGIAQVARNNTAEFVRSSPPRFWSFAAAASIVFVLFAGFYLWHRYMPHKDPVIMAAVTADTRESGKLLR